MESLAFVESEMNYSVDNGIPPDYYFYETRAAGWS